MSRLGLFGAHLPLALEYDEERIEKKQSVLKVLRLINTAERWHSCELGHFATLEYLQQLDAAINVLNSKFEGGGSLFSSLRFGRRQVVDGWDFKFRLLPKDSGYVVALNSLDRTLGAFGTDAKGIIYQGADVLATGLEPELPTARSLIVDASPIDFKGTYAQRFGASLRTVALGAPAQLMCCGGCCRCSCCSTGGGGKGCTSCCTNCGCGTCVWCCC